VELYLHPQYAFIAWRSVKHRDNFNFISGGGGDIIMTINTVVAELESSTPLIPKSAIRHDPESVPSNSPLNVILPFFLGLPIGRFSRSFPFSVLYAALVSSHIPAHCKFRDITVLATLSDLYK
jgi:hypothetical protein